MALGQPHAQAVIVGVGGDTYLFYGDINVNSPLATLESRDPFISSIATTGDMSGRRRSLTEGVKAAAIENWR
jgi:hypothetical protein